MRRQKESGKIAAILLVALIAGLAYANYHYTPSCGASPALTVIRDIAKAIGHPLQNNDLMDCAQKIKQRLTK